MITGAITVLRATRLAPAVLRAAPALLAASWAWSYAQQCDFPGLIPSPAALLPPGIVVARTVPDTLDLAEVARRYISGATRSVDPGGYFAPQAGELSDNFSYDGLIGPKFAAGGWGAPNWGEVMLSLALCREMTPYDRDDAAGTLTAQYRMYSNMMDRDANVACGTAICFPDNGVTPITPSTYALLAMIRTYRQRPTPALRTAIATFMRMHKTQLFSSPNRGDRTFYFYSTDDSNYDLPQYGGPSPVGNLGRINMPFTQGIALGAFIEVVQLFNDDDARDLAAKMVDYILHVDNDVLWTSPDPTQFDFQPFQGFNGQIYAWLEATRPILMYAEIVRPSDPARSQALVAFAATIYAFIKGVVQTDWVGAFGSSGTGADMILVGLLLAAAGAGDFYDEVDGWLRNMLVESQIGDVAVAIVGNNSDPRWQYDHVGDKSYGLFWGGAAHIFHIPTGSQGFTSDDHAMSMRGVHAAWENTVTLVGTGLRVNLHLNRTHRYAEVRSDVPHRGRVEAELRADIGPVETLSFRVPAYLPTRDGVRVVRVAADGTERDAPFAYGGPYGTYAVVAGVRPSERYALIYPTIVQVRPVVQRRPDTSIWFEGLFTSRPNTEAITTVPGTYRMTTLVHGVSAYPMPVGAIPRFADPLRTHLYALGSAEEAPPTKTVSRFVAAQP